MENTDLHPNLADFVAKVYKIYVYIILALQYFATGKRCEFTKFGIGMLFQLKMIKFELALKILYDMPFVYLKSYYAEKVWIRGWSASLANGP